MLNTATLFMLQSFLSQENCVRKSEFAAANMLKCILLIDTCISMQS